MRRFTLALAVALGAGLALGGVAGASPRKACHGAQRPCGDECYDPFTESCQPGALVCRAAQRACGGQCYDPFYQRCSTGKVECAGSQKPCGEQCYDPVTEDCRLATHGEPPEPA
ncbi:hypothetical protein [Nannocystis bainbridge]|uniref:Uncharacterized protein n=1 Tax=Nannocystis bainbridge TaxID=2995303 RepID=A0ABT5DS92_9BACT|nr:hypothetical protein [Nannocystis bainbridge]MDC0715929.1 hypothetical protein [Nannocystis bainbridge]